MPQDVLRALTSQVDWWWGALFRPRIEGLTDEEFLWAPVPDCWTLRPTADGRSEVDFHWPPPKPPPFTTIAWRMLHIGVGCLAGRTKRYFPEFMPEPWDVEPHAPVTPFPPTASEAISFLERWWQGWRAGLGAMTEADLWRPLAGVEGDYPEMQLGTEDPFIHMVLHNHRELMHHGGEIGTLRDLYREQQPKDAFVTAVLRADRGALRDLLDAEPEVVARYRDLRPDLPMRAAELGNHDAVRLVAELGFDLDDMTEKYTALQHAASGGDIPLLGLLIDLGADPGLHDLQYDADTLGWAEFFHQDKAAAFLRELIESGDA